MKIRTTAFIKTLILDGASPELPDPPIIDLEFSAIDTGGAFRDPILDFTFSIPDTGRLPLSQSQHEIELRLGDPQREDNTVTFSCECETAFEDEKGIEINGRLDEGNLNRDVIGFVMKRFR